MYLEPAWILVVGAPGSGKGSTERVVRQRLVEEDHDCDGFSVSDQLGKNPEAKKIMVSGELVPNELTKAVVRQKLRTIPHIQSKILFLDGAGRTVDQFDDLYQAALDLKCRLIVVYINTPLEDCFQRCVDRPNDPGERRPDDDPTIVTRRFEVFLKETLPVIQHVQERKLPFIEVVGNPAIKNKEESIKYVANNILMELLAYSNSGSSISTSSHPT